MFRSCKRYFAAAVLFSIAAAFLDMLTPKLVQYTVDHVLGNESPSSPLVAEAISCLGGRDALRSRLWIVALIVALVALVSALFRYLYHVVNVRGTEKMIKRLRDRLFDHILHLPFSWHDKNHTGDIIQRCTSDVETVRNFVADQMTALFRIVILIILSLVFMFRIHTGMAFISAAFVPIVILYSLFFHNKIGNAFRHADEEEGHLSAIAQENLTGVRVVRAFGRERYERERFEVQNESYTKMWIRLMGWLSAFWSSNDFITAMQIMLITVVGAVCCVKGSISVGAYIAFTSYNSMLAWPIRELGRVISDMSRVGVSMGRIRYILDSPVEESVAIQEDAKAASSSNDIVFEHVSFSYADGPKVLEDVSFELPAGKTLGILGGTGAGKSTLMYLLERLYELPKDCGRITLGGRDIRGIPLKELRSRVGLVLQEPFLFSRTLAENIAITQPGAPDMNAVEKAAGTADLKETVARFTEGYETSVGERGVTLSGGQKQRCAIAQLLVKDPPVMIFDDSLSAVDMETDARIRRALKEHTKGASLILISHRITTLKQADHIIVLDRGRIAEEGTHEELMQAGGIYRQICDIQTEGAEL